MPTRRNPRYTSKATLPKRYGKSTRVRSSFRPLRAINKSKGYLELTRKLPEIYVRNTNVVNTAQVNDPTGTCVLLGTPIVDAVHSTCSIPFSMAFQLNQIINFTDLTNIADFYKIKYITVKITFLQSEANVGAQKIMPQLQYIVDHDDASVPTSVNQFREKMGARFKTFKPNEARKIQLVPKIRTPVFDGVALNAYQPGKSGAWLDSDYPAIPHYGVKGILSNVDLSLVTNAWTSFKFDVTVTMCGKDFQ